jgi:hypothetical protein
MKAILNLSDESLPKKYSPPVRQTNNVVGLDYLGSDDLNILEEGIKETMRGVNYARLVVGIAFAKIDREALYVQAGCKSYLEYLDTAEERVQMSRQAISDYKRIGEIYLHYKSQLQRAGFREEGNLHKLRWLPRALERHSSEEVLRRLVTDSLRKFREFALSSERSDETQIEEYNPKIEVADKKISIDGQNILRLDPNLEQQTRDELVGYLKKIYTIRAKGNVPCILDLYDELEWKAVENFLKKSRARK